MTLALAVTFGIAIVMLVVGGATTTIGPWYRTLRKPAWTPPDFVFAPAWTTILGLAALAGAIGWSHAGTGQSWRLVALFGVNIALYAAWSPLFFNLRRPDWALLEIVPLFISIAALIAMLAPLSLTAAALLLPYLVWVGFAGTLNLTIVRLNKPFGAAAGHTESALRRN